MTIVAHWLPQLPPDQKCITIVGKPVLTKLPPSRRQFTPRSTQPLPLHGTPLPTPLLDSMPMAPESPNVLENRGVGIAIQSSIKVIRVLSGEPSTLEKLQKSPPNVPEIKN